MGGLLLAQPTSDNAPAGALFTLWFPLGLFVIVASILWVQSARPHRRVPPRRPAPAHGASRARGATAAAGTPPSRSSGEQPPSPGQAGQAGQAGEAGPQGRNGSPGGDDPGADG